MLYAIIGMLVIIADQYIKFWTQGHVALNAAGEEFIPGILSITNVHNDGAAFGILSGSGARIPFIILAGAFTLVVIIALATGLISGRLARWSIVLVTAGGLSNCLDRVVYGYVQDMFKTEFINFPVFNLADAFITVFAIIFALAVIFGKTRKDDEYEDAEEFEDDEEEAPRVSRRKAKRKSRRAREEEDEYDEDEEDEEPVRKPRRPARKQRAAAAVEEEEEKPAPAQKRSVLKRAQTAKKAETEAESGDDPFAAWEQANARMNARKQQQTVANAQRSGQRAAKAASADAAEPAAQPRRTTATAQPAAPKTAAKPAASRPTAAPKAAAAPKPAAKPAVEEEFSLDDILNEFK